MTTFFRSPSHCALQWLWTQPPVHAPSDCVYCEVRESNPPRTSPRLKMSAHVIQHGSSHMLCGEKIAFSTARPGSWAMPVYVSLCIASYSATAHFVLSAVPALTGGASPGIPPRLLLMAPCTLAPPVQLSAEFAKLCPAGLAGAPCTLEQLFNAVP